MKNNSFEILDKISNDGSEIETLFVERISQLVKPAGVAAMVLPTSILNKENESFISARESILKNFMIRAIVLLGSKTFGETGTNTVILFLEKFKELPKRIDFVKDSVDSIFEANILMDWEDDEIYKNYLDKMYSVPELDEYAYYLNLKDMIDFESFSFSKAIRTIKPRVLKTNPSLVNYKLSNTQIFDISIGNRVVSDEIEENGSIPIYSANVFEEFGRTNKQNIIFYSSP